MIAILLVDLLSMNILVVQLNKSMICIINCLVEIIFSFFAESKKIAAFVHFIIVFLLSRSRSLASSRFCFCLSPLVDCVDDRKTSK